MRKLLIALTGLFAIHTAPTWASDLGINVILSGEIKPGVYGQVQLGNTPPPRVVYSEPRVVVVDRRYAHEAPVYLHVPPGHIKHWDKHCHEYNACNRRVFFVRSEEYDHYEHDRAEHHRDRDHHHDHHDD